MNEDNEFKSLKGDLLKARTKSFSPGFSARVTAAAFRESNAESERMEFFASLKAAFFRTAVVAATACVILFVWIRLHPGSEIVSQSTTSVESGQSMEAAMENATYKAMEEML